MRTTRILLGFGVAALLSTILLSSPGCGSSGPATGTGPMLQDAPPPAEGQMSSADFNKARKKK